MNGSPQEQLSQRWHNLAGRLGCSPDHSDRVFAGLAARYAEPYRHYHTLAHLEQMFRILDRLEPQRPPELDLAVWFHDAIYDPRANDNEEASALLARRELSQLGVAQRLIDETCRLVLLTKTHESGDPSGQLLLDADLSILGEPEQVYDAYASAIRQEYDWVPEDQYRQGRADVLRRFLGRPHIYNTAPMRASHEASARRNLGREIHELGSRE